MRAMIVLTPSESKRFIAKGVVKMDKVQKAFTEGYVILCEGSTNVFVANELLGLKISTENFLSGISSQGVFCNSAREVRGKFPLIIYKGEIVDKTIREALDDYHKETVFIKGANAIDSSETVGMIVSGYTGGSIAEAIGTCVSQGMSIISPIGLEKSVSSVIAASKVCGGKTFDYSMGADFGLMVVPQAKPITEIETIKILSNNGVVATHVASGGINGSEGSVALVMEGEEELVKDILKIVENLKGEPPQKAINMSCDVCKYVNCRYHKANKYFNGL